MIPINIMTQPNDVTCGPTCLHAVYTYWGDTISLEEIISEVTYLETGGTLAVLLATHALRRGYDARVYTYNLQVFDPTWFNGQVNLIDKLHEQLKYKQDDPKLRMAILSYSDFIREGGQILYKNLTPSLLKHWFMQGVPLISGLSSTFLYNAVREYTTDGTDVIPDDVRGYPCGHFVVLCGYNDTNHHIVVADPYQKNTVSGDNYYSVSMHHLINSIMLGVLTYEANLLVIQKKNPVGVKNIT